MNLNVFLLNVAKALKRVPYGASISRAFNSFRHRHIAEQFDSICDQVAREMNVSGADVQFEEAVNDGPVWVFWWQGLESAPARVKACVDSIKRNAANRDVIVITKDNVSKYTDLPDYVFRKLAEGKITLTHFSDILRFNLLKLHGGLWMDATLYAVRPLDSHRYSGRFFTCSGYPDSTFFNVSDGRWTGFFIGGVREEPLFEFMDRFFALYWERNNSLADYFLIDYALDYAYRNGIGSLRTWCEGEQGKDNPKLFDLAPVICDSFDSNVWKRLTEHTDAFKLSWKKPSSYPEGSFGDRLVKKMFFDNTEGNAS